jgi:uncharacterized membrane protein HdeD (DUF308 family)
MREDSQMSMNQISDPNPETVETAIRDHWVLFLAEGFVLIVLGFLAAIVPSIGDVSVTIMLGWLFLLSGIVGLATTFWARHAPGFVWSLISAALGILVGLVLIAQRTQDLYGAPIGWPFESIGSLWLVLAFFFFVEGGVSIMLALEHRRQFSGRWAWMLASGIIDITLASLVIFSFRGASAWIMGLLVGINMIAGGASLIAMGMHARTEAAGSK